MKTIITFFFIFLFCSCSKEVVRPPIEGYVFDSITKKKIEFAEIRYEGEPKTENVNSNNKGFFSISKFVENTLFSLEGGPKEFKLIITSEKYLTDTIIKGTRWGFSGDPIKIDTIFLKPRKK